MLFHLAPLLHTEREHFTGIVKAAATTNLLFKQKLALFPVHSIFFVLFSPDFESLYYMHSQFLLGYTAAICMHVIKHTFVRN